MRKGFLYLSLMIAVTAILCGQCYCGTLAGTNINAQATCNFTTSDGSAMPAVSSNTAVVTVGSLFALNCITDISTKTVSRNETAKYVLTVQNLTNAPDSYIVSIPAQTTGWQAGVFVDADSDEVVDSGELKTSVQTLQIQPNSTYNLTIVIVQTSQLASGASCQASIAVSSVGDSTVAMSLTVSAVLQDVARCIREWALLGYFANSDTNRLLIDYLDGEGDAAPGVSIATSNWQSCISTSDIVDLYAYYNNPSNCVSYAGSYLYSDTPLQANLVYTATNGSQVWFNGKSIYIQQTPPADPSQNRIVPIQLQGGWNRLILKLAQTTGSWQYSAAITDTAGQLLPNITTSTVRQQQALVTITGVSVTNITTNSATITWNTDLPTSTILGYGVSSTSSLSYKDTALTTSHTVVLNGLTAGTSYQFLPGGKDVFGYDVSGNASIFSTQAVNPSGWINSWLINGPYYTTYSGYLLATNFLYGEASILPYDGKISNSRRWTSAQSDGNGILDFMKYYPVVRPAAGYAHVYVYSPIRQTCQLRTGSDDGIKVWLNGQVVLYRNVWRSLVPDQDKTTITFNYGWNRLLIKVSQGSGPWQLCARITNIYGTPVSGLQYRLNKP